MAVAPLFLVWFGFGLMSKVLITFLVAFFPVLIAAVVGLQATEVEKLHVARAAGAPRVALAYLSARIVPVIRFELKEESP